MSGKNGKDNPGQKRPSGRSRSDHRRIREREINRALASAGDQKGPIIVRVAKDAAKPAPKRPSEAMTAANKTTRVAKKKENTNSAMADALLAAGLKVGRETQVGGDAYQNIAKPNSPASKVRRQKKRASEPPERKKPKASVKRQKVKKRKKAISESEAQNRSKREKRFLAALPKKTHAPEPSNLRWQQRQHEIADLIDSIEGASFAKLAFEWKKHVSLTGYIKETGRKSERLSSYVALISAIEFEWGRRAKLTFNSEHYFDWPSTRAGRNRKGVADIDWAEEGFLSYLGYHVGDSSDLTDQGRRAILRRTFKMILPPLESPDYLKSWGQPASPARLRKMAHSLASFARSAKRRNASSFALAISQWEADLAMLREEFYVAQFGFGWPTA